MVLILCAVAVPARAQAPEIDLRQYLAELDRCLAAVRAAEHDAQAIPALQRSLPNAWTVRREDERIHVSAEWLNDQLEQWEESAARRDIIARNVEARLLAMRKEAETRAAGAAAPADARSRAREILARAEFATLRREPTWLDRLRDRIYKWIDQALFGVSRRLTNIPGLQNLIIWSALVVAFAVAVIWVKRAVERSVASPSLRVRDLTARDRTVKDWLVAARGAAEKDDDREALRCLYWAGVYRLEELGAWKKERARTHREYLRLLPEAHAPLRPALTALTKSFERVWYGRQEPAIADLDSAAANLETLGCRFSYTKKTAKS